MKETTTPNTPPNAAPKPDQREAKLNLLAARVAFLAAYLFLPVSFWMSVSAGPVGLLYVLGDLLLFWVAFSWGGRPATPAQHPVVCLILLCEAMLALFYRG